MLIVKWLLPIIGAPLVKTVALCKSEFSCMRLFVNFGVKLGYLFGLAKVCPAGYFCKENHL